MIIVGVDPGLRTTGWGVVVADGNRLAHIANGRITTGTGEPLSRRLAILGEELNDLLIAHDVKAAAMEEVFVNQNAQSTLKLAQARGALLAVLGFKGIAVGEYAARAVKLSVTGTGGAEKIQVHAMVARLLPAAKIDGADAADALAVAICHAHHLASARRIIRD